MDQEILQRGVQNLLRFWNLLIGVLNDENLPQMEKFLTVLILANDIVDTLTIIRIAIERTLWYFLKKIYKYFFFFK